MSKSNVAMVGWVFVCALTLLGAKALRGPAAVEDGIEVYFSPHGGCADAIIREIDRAQSTIEIQAYSFTSAAIAKAVLEATKRGVKATVVLDHSQRTNQYSSATFFLNQGIPVFIDAEHEIAHNKVILIDREVIITGSYNFSSAAEKSNAENLLIIRGKRTLVAAYADNLRRHLEHSTEYSRPQPAQPAATRDDSPRNEVTVFITNTGKRYHVDGCQHLKSRIPASLEDAKARGYTPCRRCHPPQAKLDPGRLPSRRVTATGRLAAAAAYQRIQRPPASPSRWPRSTTSATLATHTAAIKSIPAPAARAFRHLHGRPVLHHGPEPGGR